MKKIFCYFCIIVAVSGCGGSDSSSGSGEDDLQQYITINLIQYHLNNPDYQPTQAEIDCVQDLPSTGNSDIQEERVIDCVNNN